MDKNMNDKILSFEYIQKCMLDWYADCNGRNYKENDLSILKSLKLLFFVSAVKAERGVHSALIEDVFNKFYAMPYGHVESDILNVIKERNGDLNYFLIDNERTTVKVGVDIEEIRSKVNSRIAREIDISIQSLRDSNPYLIRMSAFDLVNLSHTWYSWQRYYDRAKEQGQRSSIIPSDVIKSEDKIFNLQTI